MLSEQIVVRNPALKWPEGYQRYWFGGSAIRTNWMNALSTTFPEVAAFAKRLPKAVTGRAREPESDTDNSQPIAVHKFKRAQLSCKWSGFPDPRGIKRCLLL